MTVRTIHSRYCAALTACMALVFAAGCNASEPAAEPPAKAAPAAAAMVAWRDLVGEWDV